LKRRCSSFRRQREVRDNVGMPPVRQAFDQPGLFCIGSEKQTSVLWPC
jgi:hypothetical protein